MPRCSAITWEARNELLVARRLALAAKGTRYPFQIDLP